MAEQYVAANTKNTCLNILLSEKNIIRLAKWPLDMRVASVVCVGQNVIRVVMTVVRAVALMGRVTESKSY